MSISLTRSILPAILLIAMAARPLAGDELRAAVDKFLETGAKVSATNFSQAAAQYRQLQAQAPDDARIEYACAIVLLNQRKYANALPLLARYTASAPDDFEAAAAHAWALIQCRRYREALAAAEQLGANLSDASAGSAAARTKTVLTIGRLLGYFERTRPGNISSEEILKVKNSLLAHLSQEQIATLDEGTALTAATFEELAAARQERLAVQAASSEQSRDSVADSLAETNSQAAKSEAERDAKASESQDAARQWSLLQTQIAGLTQDRARVSAQMLTVQALLQQLSQTYDLGTFGSGNEFRRVQQQTISLEGVARAQQYSLQLAALNKQAFDMDRKLLEYGRQAQALRAEGAAQGDAAARSEELRQDATKRAALLDRRLRQLERTRPATAATMTAQMRSLSTYLPFDYAGERARVLSWFDGSK